MSLAELGASVIRIDPLEGGVDYHRWPVTDTGTSLYWAGLNKGKKSVSIDIRSAEGRELAQAIITAPGPDAGIFVSNFPAAGWLDFEGLKKLRDDLIMVNIVGNRDGSTALDYTVNCAVGFPQVTGTAGETAPTNHVLPAWDLICGMTAATGLLAAERYRRLHKAGQLLKSPFPMSRSPSSAISASSRKCRSMASRGSGTATIFTAPSGMILSPGMAGV